jgi:magnesium transporter
LFSSLDEEVAAEALEEIDVKTQRKLIESLDSEQVAGILDEMDPGAAADLLSELTEERSDAILEEMGERERHDVEELLEYDPDSAAGLMTSDYLALPAEATVLGALQALENFDGDPETVTDVFILDADGHVSGVVPLARLAIARPEVNLGDLPMSYVVCAALDANGRKVAELFDKYNLRCLPVIDEDECLAGVVHAENVIAWLRTRQ